MIIKKIKIIINQDSSATFHKALLIILPSIKTFNYFYYYIIYYYYINFKKGSLKYESVALPFFTEGGTPDQIDDYFFNMITNRSKCNYDTCPEYQGSSEGYYFF